MHRKIKVAFLIVIAILLTIVLVELIDKWILINPKPLFDYHYKHKSFTIHSDMPIKNDLLTEFDDALKRIRVITLFDSKAQYKVFICNNPDLYKKFANKMNKPKYTQGFIIQPINLIFINHQMIKQMAVNNQGKFKNNIMEGNLAHIISHEITHQLLADRFGYFETKRVESWKLEGYCEYAAAKWKKAKDANYNFKKEIRKFESGYYNELSPGRRFYIKSQLITTFYLDHLNYHLDQFMETKISEDSSYQQLVLTIK